MKHNVQPPKGRSGGSDAVSLSERIKEIKLDMWEAGFAAGRYDALVNKEGGTKTEPFKVEFPFTNGDVTLEQDDGGLWVTVGTGAPYWIGPKALNALITAFTGGVS